MCSGGDLKYHLKANATSEKKDRSFSNERSRFYAAEVLLGLEHIHSFDIVYRDLKPNNILLDAIGIDPFVRHNSDSYH
jgi:serine/threonine protein kinase